MLAAFSSVYEGSGQPLLLGFGYEVGIWYLQERFPPNIYYKIFTHRPVQDMCANSPKDYTRPSVKLQIGKDRHSELRTQGLQDGRFIYMYNTWLQNGRFI